MKAFLGKCGDVVRGVLNGFDRLFFRGTLRNLSYPRGLQNYLWANRIPYKDFAQHSETVTEQLEDAALREARQQQRPVVYLNTHKVKLDAEAKRIAAKDKIRSGLICVFRRVEPCMSFQICRNRATKKLEITYRPRQCMNQYH